MEPRRMILPLYFALKAYEAACLPVCKELKLPQTSFDILVFLANNPQYYTAKDITQIRGIQPSMVSFHVEKLVHAGLLFREPIKGDRRQVKLRCTEKALPIIEKAHNAQKKYLDAMCSGFDEEELEAFRHLLEKLERNANNVIDQKSEFLDK